MNSRAIAALLAIALLSASTSAAQTSASAASFVDPSSGLSLDAAVARALAQEPSLQAAKTTVDAARGMQVQAGLRRNPSISTELRREPGGHDNQTMVSVEWPLDLFRRQGRVAVAEREVAAVERSVANRERLLAADVRAHYGDVLVAVRDLTLLEELVEAARRQYDLQRSRVDEGASPPLERDLVDVELRRFEADRLLQLGRAERAMFELKRSLGMAPSDSLRVRDALEEVVNRELAATVPTAEAVNQRPDVREAEARVAVADARIDRAKRDGRFDVSLFGGYMRMDTAFPQFGVTSTGTLERVHGLFHYAVGGAMVTVPLFDRNQGELGAARAERAGAVGLHRAAELSAQTELATARAADQRAREAVQLYGDRARTLARQNLSVVRQSFELGRTTIFEVLAEQKRYLELERAYTETLRAAYEARTELKRALGELP
jgi:cobalt-zinc-cadmium efflux system outer membrane protein